MGARSCMKDTWCWKCINSKTGKLTKFLILLLLDLIDVCVDWYFYAKVKLIEPGLVYGPPEESYKWAVFAFCIVSTLTLLIETIQNVDDLGKEKKLPFLTQSLTNFLTIIFEDLPLLLLNLILTLCRDGDVSVISLTKASVCIVCVAVRFILMIFVYWIFDKKKSRFEFICDSISTIGLICVAILSITIQLLNNFPIDNNGIIKFKFGDPKTFNHNAFLKQKYFDNIDIYMKWPPSNDSSLYNNQQIWLTSLNEMNFTKQIDIELKLSDNIDNQMTKNYTMCVLKSTENEKLINCYEILNYTHVYELNSQSAQQLNFGYNLIFKKENPNDFKYLLGYIDYNIKIKQDNNKCIDYESSSINKTNLLVYARFMSQNDHPTINKTTTTIKNDYFKYNEGVDYYSLFNFYYDLEIVSNIWRTGIIGCKTSGDISPKLNRNINILC